MVEVAGRSEGKKLLSTVLVWLRNNVVGDCVDSSKIFLIVASISDMNFIVFFFKQITFKVSAHQKESES